MLFQSNPRVACINDLRSLAQKRVPKMFFDYAASGSYSQQTLKWNSIDLSESKIKLRQRVAVDVSKRSTKSSKSKFASSSSNNNNDKCARPLPLGLSPIGLCGMQHVNGEIAAARAAAQCNVPFTLSTMSITSIKDLRKNVPELRGDNFYFQLYMMKDREFMSRLINEAKQAGCGALVLTLDLQILGLRFADIYNGLSAPPNLYNLRTLLQLARCPRWCINQVLFAKRFNFGNIVDDKILASKVEDITSLSSWTSGQFDPSVAWDVVKWVREQWGYEKPLIVKGILDEQDAVECYRTGCVDAIIVSNHGGRQLDGAPSSISKLYSIRKAVEEEEEKQQNSKGRNNHHQYHQKPEIHFDGGITTGQSIFKALALGADFCWIGRSYVWGLGAMGEEGVKKSIDILQKELDVTMALTGCESVDRDIGLERLILSDEVKREFGILR